MPLTSDQSIADMLQSVKTIGVLGASHKPQRPSFRVMEVLISHNYVVVPINPALSGTELLGQRVYGALAEVPFAIDMVDVFRNSSHLPTIVDDVIELGIRNLWTQLDVIDLQAASRAELHGIRVVMDRCLAIEMPRLKQAGLL